jgi:hypothetical protein
MQAMSALSRWHLHLLDRMWEKYSFDCLNILITFIRNPSTVVAMRFSLHHQGPQKHPSGATIFCKFKKALVYIFKGTRESLIWGHLELPCKGWCLSYFIPPVKAWAKPDPMLQTLDARPSPQMTTPSATPKTADSKPLPFPTDAKPCKKTLKESLPIAYC